MELSHVLQLFFFLPVAWWLQGRQRLILLILALALALTGFVLGVYRSLDAASLVDLIALKRPGFI